VLVTAVVEPVVEVVGSAVVLSDSDDESVAESLVVLPSESLSLPPALTLALVASDADPSLVGLVDAETVDAVVPAVALSVAPEPSSPLQPTARTAARDKSRGDGVARLRRVMS
jgi:hypothetical protein